jgi:transcription antitermination factor NusG
MGEACFINKAQKNYSIMITEKKWYAVYTRPRWEKKVAELLAKRKVEVFCPLNKVMRQWADRKKMVMEPLFTSYVFVRAEEAEYLTIKQTDGIINFVYWLGNPAVIKDDEIFAIKNFLSEHLNVKLEKVAINISDRVRITDGLLVHREGDVLEVKSKTVKILLPSLGYAMTAEVSKTKIEVINYTQNIYSANDYYKAKVV